MSKALNTAGDGQKSGTGAVDVVLEYGNSPVNASPGRPGQAFLNLIMNGIQAYDSRHPNKRLFALCAKATQGRFGAFEDFGRGSPKAAVAHFDPFTSGSRDARGWGTLGHCSSSRWRHRSIRFGRGNKVEVRLPIPSGSKRPRKFSGVGDEFPLNLVDDEPALT